MHVTLSDLLSDFDTNSGEMEFSSRLGWEKVSRGGVLSCVRIYGHSYHSPNTCSQKADSPCTSVPFMHGSGC